MERLIKFDVGTSVSYVNPDRVAWVNSDANPAWTRIWFSGAEDDYMLVREPLADVVIRLAPLT